MSSQFTKGTGYGGQGAPNGDGFLAPGWAGVPNAGGVFLVGAPGAGKSVMLRLSGVAAKEDELARMHIIPGRNSSAFYEEADVKLIVQGRPAEANKNLSPDTYDLLVTGKRPPVNILTKFEATPPKKVWRRTFYRLLAEILGRRIVFAINALDRAGGAYLTTMTQLENNPTEMLQWVRMAFGSLAMIYVYDAAPAEDIDVATVRSLNSHYFDATVHLISQLRAHEYPASRLMLPLVGLIVLTKLDHPNVWEPLDREHLIDLSTGMPRIAEPARAFQAVAGQHFYNQVMRNFARGRVDFAVVSSYGPYREPDYSNLYTPGMAGLSNQVHPRNYMNSWLNSEGEEVIRTREPHPYGVIEAYLRLYDRLVSVYGGPKNLSKAAQRAAAEAQRVINKDPVLKAESERLAGAGALPDRSTAPTQPMNPLTAGVQRQPGVPSTGTRHFTANNPGGPVVPPAHNVVATGSGDAGSINGSGN